ncbi:acylphosphatase [Leifsonia flava]|uniref:acylphosphatase n=1 Tax=Orlajensenia leifsoniae TaxID=2561933 RepID=A0A4Y9R4W8_9MICO|nr:acylphosphatase [Leifsonia flava]TFV99674.1 acylphosphatase [Leifsonia flava]
MTAKHVVVHGGVQGVGFRWFAREEAARLCITGWIRNRDDGTVEAVVDGDDAAVDAMVAWFRVGPPEASVTAVDVTKTDAAPSTGFSIER